MENAQTFFQNINWSNPSWDLFIAIVFVVGSLLYGFSLGRDRLIVILVSIYMALALIGNAPYLDRLGQMTQTVASQIFVFQITGFVGIFIVLFFFLSRSALLRTIASRDEQGSWWQVMMFSVLHVGLMLSVIMSFLPADALNHLSPFTRQIFTYEGARFAWLVAPIIAMMLVRKPQRKRSSVDDELA